MVFKQFLCLGLGTVSAFSAAQERWIVVSYSGQPVGFYCENNLELKTDINSKVVLKRLGKSVTIQSTSSVIEDKSGAVASFTGEFSTSNSTSKSSGRVVGRDLTMQVTTGGKTYDRKSTLTDSLLGPSGIRRLTLSRLTKAGDHVKYLSLFPELGVTGDTERILLGRESLKVNGHVYQTLHIQESVKALGVNHQLWLDSAGLLLKSRDETPFGLAIQELSTKAVAMRASEGGTLKDEVYSRSIVLTNVRLPDPRSLDRVVLKVAKLSKEIPWPDFDSETQRLLKQDEKVSVVEVRRLPVPVNHTNTGNSLSPDFSSPNEILNSDDRGVRDLAAAIAGTESDPWLAATRLRNWEAKNMKPDAGVAGAPAAEVARDRRGTCFAYSALLASMCRARNIPTRFVTGLVYTDGMYGGHFWVDARIGDKWIPLDAAMFTPLAADAARIRFSSNSLATGGSEFASTVQLYGKIRIKVLEFTRNGKTTVIPENAKPYTVSGSRYSNRWLGIRETLPHGFSFRDLNCAYPDSTIFRGVKGQDSVSLEQRGITADEGANWPDSYVKGAAKHRMVDGHYASYVIEAEGATAAIRDGYSVWILKAKGPHSAKVLGSALDGWKHL